MSVGTKRYTATDEAPPFGGSFVICGSRYGNVSEKLDAIETMNRISVWMWVSPPRGL